LSSSRSEAFFATCPRGLEPLLVLELASLQTSASAVPGGVAFSGQWADCYRANLWSRVASRILWRVAQFDYRNEQDLYAAVRALDWPRYFRVERTLRVNVTAQKSPLKSLEFATLRIKDAVCDRFRDAMGKRPSVDRADPDVRVHAFLEEKRCTLYLDTSGEPLFKRGWRKVVGEAPLRENLAAGIVMLTGWKPDEPFLDPMCGGGTILAEAAAMSRGRAPGTHRAFGFEKLAALDERAWEKVRRDTSVPQYSPTLFGSDVDAKALGVARRTLAEAGVERWVQLERADVLQRPAPAANGVMVMNPPYGERMGSPEELAAFYPKLGDALKQRFAGWRCYLFTADLRAAKLIRLTPSKRIPLWNGAIECRLYEFVIVAGSNRPTRASGPPSS
jgi:putative N6-adenine-specific DNA methylase